MANVLGSFLQQAAGELVQSFTKEFNKPELVEEITAKRPLSGLKYPLDNEYPAYIQYKTREVVPPANAAAQTVVNHFQSNVDEFLKPATDTSSAAGGTAASGKSGDTVYGDQPQIGPSAQEFANRGGTKGLLGFKTMYTKPANDIKLYLPQSLQVADAIGYDNGNLDIAGAGALNAMNNGSGILSALAQGMGDVGSSLGSIFGFGRNAALSNQGEGARVAAARAASLVQGATPQGVQNAIAIGLQVKVNPNTRSVFTGVNVRNFQFTYDFYPTSKTEMEEVKKIIYIFRKEMYPRSIPEDAYAAGFPLGFKFPNLFEIRFMYGNNKIQMPQPLLCYLRSANTTYNPNSMSFFEDGNPTHIQLSLAFQEFRALSQQDIEKGH